ncbi:MAG: site-specific DNA-methyltransferase [Synergistaceae bacterium]|nr:site-specific DNA-methyltransferase [Synergistaceae bacterium]
MNKIQGTWDVEKLADVLSSLKEINYDICKTGFDIPEVESIFSSIYDKEVKEDNFDVDEEQATFSKVGDLWVLGKHRIICGDSTVPETYERLMDGVKADLLLTDPPYLVAYSNMAGSIKNDNLTDREGYEFLRKAFECFADNLADNSAAYVFYASTKARVFHDAFEDAGFRVSSGLVWRKDSMVLSRTDYQQNFEPIIYGWKRDGRHTWYGDRKQTTCFDFVRPKNAKKEGHPTSKPVQLMAYLIKQSTASDGIVLDGFHGSGSTMMACEQLGRKCRAIELDEKFVDVQVQRYIKFTGNSDVYVIRDGKRLRYADIR